MWISKLKLLDCIISVVINVLGVQSCMVQPPAPPPFCHIAACNNPVIFITELCDKGICVAVNRVRDTKEDLFEE